MYQSKYGNGSVFFGLLLAVELSMANKTLKRIISHLIVIAGCLTFGQVSSAGATYTCESIFSHIDTNKPFIDTTALISFINQNGPKGSWGWNISSKLTHISNFDVLRSNHSPINLTNNFINPNNMSLFLYGNKIYFDTFFIRNVKIDWAVPIAINFVELIGKQPYLVFRDGKYILLDGKHGPSASRELLLQLLQQQSSVRLYRGTSLLEARLLKIYKQTEHSNKIFKEDFLELKHSLQSEINRLLNKINDGDATAANKLKLESMQKVVISIDKNENVAYIIEQVKSLLRMSLSNLIHGAVFFSTDQSRAKYFSKGAVIEFEFHGKALLDLLEKQKIYLGIESSIEVAFDNSSLDYIIQGFRDFHPMDSGPPFATRPY